MRTESFSRRMITLLPQLIRGISRYESNSLSRGEITLPQLWALEYLAQHDGCPMHELARALAVSRPAATGLVNRLTAQRLVTRAHDTADRRLVLLSITAKGDRIRRNIWEQKRRAIARVFGSLPATDRAQYLAILERVAQRLSQQHVGG